MMSRRLCRASIWSSGGTADNESLQDKKQKFVIQIVNSYTLFAGFETTQVKLKFMRKTTWSQMLPNIMYWLDELE